MKLEKRQAIHQLEIFIHEVSDFLKISNVAKESGYMNLGSADSKKILRQCLDLCIDPAISQGSIRTIHHLACTGGTLISKCLCSMPNCQMLSEVDPLSPNIGSSSGPKFAPSDMITLLKQSRRDVDRELVIDLFMSNLKILYEDAFETGRRLVIRDHAHSHFHTGNEIPSRPSLLSIIKQKFSVSSVVTVRHPIDSYLSLRRNKWLHFNPQTLEEYCRRYLNFLDSYKGVLVFRYEDFLRDPKSTMYKICKELDLNYSSDFEDVFHLFRLTGDSGRSSEQISYRERLPVSDKILQESRESNSYSVLCAKLGYEKLI